MAEKTCFVICPIDKEDTPIRRRSDLVLEYLIRPAAESLGYTVTRSDRVAEPGFITSQIVEHIVKDKMVIADLTGQNPNVFYELAIRHSYRLPYVLISEVGASLPFDISPLRAIMIDASNIAMHASYRDQITAQIKFSEENPDKAVSPVSMGIEIAEKQNSDKPGDLLQGEILSKVENLGYRISVLSGIVAQLQVVLPQPWRQSTSLFSTVPAGTQSPEFKALADQTGAEAFLKLFVRRNE